MSVRIFCTWIHGIELQVVPKPRQNRIRRAFICVYLSHFQVIKCAPVLTVGFRGKTADHAMRVLVAPHRRHSFVSTPGVEPVLLAVGFNHFLLYLFLVGVLVHEVLEHMPTLRNCAIFQGGNSACLASSFINYPSSMKLSG